MWTTSATLVFISVLFLFFPAYVTWHCALSVQTGALAGAEQWGDEASGPWEPRPAGAPPLLAPDSGSRPVAERLAVRLAYFLHQEPEPLIHGNCSRAPRIVLDISCAQGCRNLAFMAVSIFMNILVGS